MLTSFMRVEMNDYLFELCEQSSESKLYGIGFECRRTNPKFWVPTTDYANTFLLNIVYKSIIKHFITKNF